MSHSMVKEEWSECATNRFRAASKETSIIDETERMRVQT